MCFGVLKRTIMKAFLIISVCRRPVVQNVGPVPDNWDKTQIPETGYSVL